MADTSLLVLLVSAFIVSASGLQCYHCTYNKVQTDFDLVDWILDGLSKLSDEHCKLERSEDVYEIAIRTCPDPKQGHVYKCGTVSGTVTAKLSLLTVEYITIERDCIEVPEDDPDYKDGCHDDLPSSGPGRTLLEKTFSGLNLGEVEFSGQACYDDKSVPIPGLLCPRCTWNQLETDNRVVQWVVDGLMLLSDDHCKFNDPDDLYEIDLRNCPPAGINEENKCGDVSGEVTGSVLGVNFKYYTLQRDCISVPVSGAVAAAYTDGCHSDVPDSGPAKDLVDESYEGMDLGDTRFNGQACYTRSFNPNASSAGPRTEIAMLISLLIAVSAIIWRQ